MSVRNSYKMESSKSFFKLAHFEVVHLRTDKKHVQEKPYDTIINFRKVLGPLFVCESRALTQ